MTIGNRMKIHRKELGLTQKELTSEVKLSQGYISMLEKGTFAPTAPTIISLAAELKISADELLGINDTKKAG
ncbi:MAG: helix-turn-helix domain-containing protein [Ruminococcus sp.]|nr:helix-turn-helix domain-containing protein [Ruminococcus sp.]